MFTGLGMAQTFTRGALTVFTVVVALDLLHTGEPGVGTLTGAIGAGAVLGSLTASLLVGSRRLAQWFGIGVALWGLPVALIPLPVVTGFPPSAREAGAEVDEMLDRFSPEKPTDDQNGSRHSH